MCFVEVPRSHQVWVAQFKRIIRWLIRIFFSATVYSFTLTLTLTLTVTLTLTLTLRRHGLLTTHSLLTYALLSYSLTHLLPLTRLLLTHSSLF